MCGLAALCAPDVTRAALVRANDALTHRGPDEAGVYLGEGVGLAARRLSIIDLVEGHQPLSNEDGTVWIAYNGEVYNAPELRVELQAAGHRFRTHSDTEVIVHAYEAWGEAAIARLRGMFALALWDAPRQRLLAARDRFGLKPLYYAQLGSRLACASEIRPIFSLLPDLPRCADRQALWQLFGLGHIPAPLTPLLGIAQLPPAYLLIWQAGQLTLKPYWRLTYPRQGEERRIAPAEAAAEFRARLRETVAAWRLSDVPVGALLSGGLDSSALAALLTEVSGGPIHTFTVTFAATSHDEAAQARRMAQAIGSRHEEIRLDSAEFDLLPAVVAHLESPQCSATSLPIYLLYRACHTAGYKVILTGEGADELLGGYHWFDGDRRLRPWLVLPAAWRRAAARWPWPISPAGRRVLAAGDSDAARRYALWQQVSATAQRQALFTFSAPAGGVESGPLPADWLDYHPLHQFLWLEAHTRLPDFINLEVDRLSMAHSVEARPPFLDHRLWEWCATLPPDLKLRPGVDKWLLREAMRGVLPEETRIRPKQGLAAPHADWWRQVRLPAWAEEGLTPTALVETGYFHPPVVARLRAAHQARRADHSRLLTGVLTTQLWHAALQLSPAPHLV